MIQTGFWLKRVIKAEERKLWQAAMRGVRRREPVPAIEAEEPQATIVMKPVATLPDVKPRRPSVKEAMTLPHVIDGETSSRLKTKIVRPQARLDLHGMTEAAAHKALTRFIAQCAKEGHHIVLIITGKGRRGDGTLRRNLPLWLETPSLRPYIIAMAPAFVRDGGEGAFYVQLRRESR